MATLPMQAPFTAPCYGAGSIVIDKTGTVFQVWTGRLTNPGAFGPHIYRTAPGGKPQLIWFMENANGQYLVIMNKQLYFSYTPAKGGQWLQQIDGYIDPSDTPSSQVVNVDETQVAMLKQSINTAQVMASGADYKATRAQTTASAANNTAAAALAKVTEQQKQIEQMQIQIGQMLTSAQVEDIVWSKIWDINYLIRLGFIDGKSSIDNVQLYLTDLASYIRRIIKV